MLSSLPHPTPGPVALAPWKVALQWGLFPATLLLAGAVCYGLSLGQIDPAGAQLGIFVPSIAAVLLAQRVLPFSRPWQQASFAERRTDATSWVVLMAALDPLLKKGLMPALLSLLVVLFPTQGLWSRWLAGWPLGLQLLLAAVVAECGQYAMHRLAHQQRWMWSVHSMHHSPRRVSLSNGFRTNPINMVWHQMAGLFVLMLLGAPALVLHMLVVLGTVLAVFQHANADLRYAGWNWFLGTADLHRWHHAREGRAGDCNYGQNLVLWDQLLGTYRRPLPGAPAPDAVGIDGVDASAPGYWRAVWASSTQRLPRTRQEHPQRL